MKLIRSIAICFLLSLAFLIAGCAKPPTEEMNNAVEAVTRAENDNDAVIYAANSIARARDALGRMNTEAASKRYDAAKSYAAEAIAIAERAIEEGRAGAARARDEAEALVSELPPLITETEQGINAAKKAGLPLDFESINNGFDTACRNADQARSALSSDRYDDALKFGRSARSDLNGITQQLSNAATSASRKK
jgi:hypothetical protein